MPFCSLTIRSGQHRPDYTIFRSLSFSVTAELDLLGSRTRAGHSGSPSSLAGYLCIFMLGAFHGSSARAACAVQDASGLLVLLEIFRLACSCLRCSDWLVLA